MEDLGHRKYSLNRHSLPLLPFVPLLVALRLCSTDQSGDADRSALALLRVDLDRVLRPRRRRGIGIPPLRRSWRWDSVSPLRSQRRRLLESRRPPVIPFSRPWSRQGTWRSRATRPISILSRPVFPILLQPIIGELKSPNRRSIGRRIGRRKRRQPNLIPGSRGHIAKPVDRGDGGQRTTV